MIGSLKKPARARNCLLCTALPVQTLTQQPHLSHSSGAEPQHHTSEVHHNRVTAQPLAFDFNTHIILATRGAYSMACKLFSRFPAHFKSLETSKAVGLCQPRHPSSPSIYHEILAPERPGDLPVATMRLTQVCSTILRVLAGSHIRYHPQSVGVRLHLIQSDLPSPQDAPKPVKLAPDPFEVYTG